MKKPQLITIILGIAFIGLLYLFFKPAANPTVNKVPEATSVATQVVTPKIYELQIQNKKLVAGSEIITVKEGDQVNLRITADTPDEFHIHGYDESVILQKDVPATLTFVANLTGRFEFELEEMGLTLGAIEVQPK